MHACDARSIAGKLDGTVHAAPRCPSWGTRGSYARGRRRGRGCSRVNSESASRIFSNREILTTVRSVTRSMRRLYASPH